MGWQLSFLFIAIVISLIAVSGLQGCMPSECYTDADCAKIQLTCCPCTSGGTDRCVSETLAPLYEEELKDCPAANESICMAQNNCKIASCGCNKGKCVER